MKQIKLGFENDVSDLKEYKNQLYAKIVNSPYYNEFLNQGFSDDDIRNNLIKFSDYIDDAEIAKKIKTFEDCKVYNKFERLTLKKIGNYIDKKYVALEPYYEYLEYNNCFEQRDFPDEYMNADFKNLDKNLKKSIKNSFTTNKWIYLHGSVNSGRTYAAVALINKKYVPEKSRIAFLNSPKSLQDLSNYYYKSRQDFDELMEIYSNVDCLVLDDFGNELKSKFLRDNILSVIFNRRIANNKMTIFTSDFSLDELCTLYGKLKDDTNDILSSRFGKILKDKIGKGLETSPLSIY